MASDDSLLDVFVRILPDPRYEADMQAAIDKTKAMFGKLNVSAGGGTGSGGGGGSSGGSSGSNDLAERYRAALRAAEDLARETRRIKTLFGDLRDADWTRQFTLAKEELTELQVQMRRGGQDADPLALEQTLERLELVRQRLNELSVQSTGRRFTGRNVASEFQNIVDQESVNRPNFGIEHQLRLQRLQGLDFGEKNRLNELTAEAKRAQVQFDALRRTFDGSEEALDRVVAATTRLSTARQSLSEMTEIAGRTTRSFNTLSNNAYQLGQAVEDAAVGFSLNGFAGAVRGSANNIAFILNDLSRMESVQSRIGKGWSNALPLIAGIGSALAILVLPKLIEWLESLNDIETKTKDISAELQRSFSEQGFEVNLSVGEAGFSRSIESAQTVKEILESMKGLGDQASDTKLKLQGVFEGFQESGGLEKIRDSLREVTGLVTDQLALIEQLRASTGPSALIENPIEELLGPFGTDTSVKAQSRLKEIAEAIGEVSQQIETASLNSKDGVFDPDQLAKTEKLLFSITESVTEFAKQADLGNDKFAEDFGKNIEQVRQQLESMRDDAKEVQSLLGQQLEAGIQGALAKTSELNARLVIQNEIVRGSSDAHKLLLFDINEEAKAYQKLIDVLIQTSEAGGRRVSQAEEDALRGSGASEIATKLLEEQEEISDKRVSAEEKIKDLLDKQNAARRSSNIELDSYISKLQSNALSGEKDTTKKAIDEQLKIVFDETRRANAFNQAISDARGQVDFRPQANDPRFATDVGQPQAMLDILNSIKEEMALNNRKTDETTKAVDNVNMVPRAK